MLLKTTLLPLALASDCTLKDLLLANGPALAADTFNLKFPDLSDFRTCQHHGHTFCYVKQSLDVSALLNASTTVSISLGLCLPYDCSVDDVESIFDALCAIPSCSIYNTPGQTLCVHVQTLHCDPKRRFRPRQEDMHLECTTEPAAYGEGLVVRRLTEELSNHTNKIDEGTIEASLGASKVTFRDDGDMETLIRCGTGSYRELKSLAYSGSLQSLGEYDMCKQSELPYCTLSYLELMVSGRCLPSTCQPSDLNRLFHFVCKNVESCLDYVDIIPPDFCFAMKVLGCSDMKILKQMMVMGEEGMSAILTRAGSNGRSNETQASSPWRHWQDGQKYAMEIARAMPLEWESLRWPLNIQSRQLRALTEESMSPLRNLQLGTTGELSVRAVCDYNPTTKLRVAVTIALLTSLFIVIPLIGLLGGVQSLSPVFNWRRFKNQRTKLSMGPFSHVQGIRALGMMWIVLGHVYTFQSRFGVMHNFEASRHFLSSYSFQIVPSGVLSVDTFFFLSGFFLAMYATDRIVKALGDSPSIVRLPGVFAITIYKRYMRLVPGIIFTMLFSYFVLPLFGSGPMWENFVTWQTVGRHGGCRKYWWTILLFINNFYETEYTAECLGHTWYLANDFQLFVVGVILICIFAFSKWAFYAATAACMAASYAVTWHIASTHGFMYATSSQWSGGNDDNLLAGVLDMMTKFYMKPYCRAGPFLIGLLAGQAYRTRVCDAVFLKEETRKGDEISTVVPDHALLTMGYIASTITMYALIFSIPYAANAEGGPVWNRFLDLATFVFQRSVWAVCIAWWTIGPSYEGGLFRKVFGNKYVVGISLLTFLVYLLHPEIQSFLAALSHKEYVMTQLGGYFDAVSHYGVTVLLSLLCYICVELVFDNLLR